MKKLLIAIVMSLGLFLFAGNLAKSEAVYVNGYYKSNGTYVSGYYRSRANAYTFDNYSYKRPTYSNGFGYNPSYYSGNYSSYWYTPSYYDSDYYYGLNSYKLRHLGY